MNIEGKICRLRALEPQDLDAMYRWENDMTTWRVSGTTAPFSRHTLSRLIDEQQFDIFATRQMRLVIENIETAEAVGIRTLKAVNGKDWREELEKILNE
jgi:diamine N-acetyltransferase